MTSRPFDKVLVANRGEIAVRVIRACRETGIASVAVYSHPDADALHVRLADEAFAIGPAPALESYLNADTLVDVALRSGAQAVHPGYGFLAENPEFAAAVQAAGLVWIGPSPQVIRLLGDKLEAKRLATAANVPVVPGFDGDGTSLQELLQGADGIGYPIMIKAAAGGGGKGMRSVASPAELGAAVEAAAREAAAAFDDSRIFLERALTRPRHIEIQIFADSHGNAVYLGERECSIQRRHQKVLEESPSPALTPELRAAMGEAALRIVRASGYVNAGTVEFLFSEGSFYFLEVNTRIQVEHPVTEMVTGLDLVRMQMEIAAGQPLAITQGDVALRGHAIEARLYAEDPSSSFLPATGRLEVFLPPSGPGVRNDVGVEPGSQVSQFYDPILAKLIVHSDTREAAVARLQTAVEDYGVLGLTTNMLFLHWIATNPAFVSGDLDTGLVAREWPPAQPEELPLEVLLLALALEQEHGSADMSLSNPWAQTGGWRAGGASRRYRYDWHGQMMEVVASQTRDNLWKVRRQGTELHDVRLDPADGGRIGARVGTKVVRGFGVVGTESLDISWKGVRYRLRRPVPAGTGTGGSGASGGERLTAPMPGTIVRVLTRAGQHVSAHEPLVVMEAMKMEHVIEAPHAGTVREVLYDEGDMVPAGSPLVRLDEE